jgi:hypothetical protein
LNLSQSNGAAGRDFLSGSAGSPAEFRSVHQGLDVCRNIRLLSAFFDQEAPMDANSGEPWTEMNIQDLRASLDFGNTYADAASMLCRDEDEVRRKAKELGLVEHRKKW